MSTEVSQTNDDLENSMNDLPEKYQGKSVTEIARMHMEAEKEKSRLANEVGSYRTMADELLGLQRNQRADKPVVERKPITTDDLVNNPDDALERAVTDNPVVMQLRQEQDALRGQLHQTKFEREFPTYQQDLANPEFAEFVKGNKVRTALGVAANRGDYEAATSLWELWNERQTERKELTEGKKQIRKAQEKAGILEGSTSGSGETEKTYSRAEMIELQRRAASGDPVAKAKWSDPTYQATRMQAYADGRVK